MVTPAKVVNINEIGVLVRTATLIVGARAPMACAMLTPKSSTAMIIRRKYPDPAIPTAPCPK
jgi:hypothetical protein